MDASTAQHILHHCDRTRSAEARHTLQRELWAPLRAHSIQLSAACILSRENDVLLLQEQAKVRLSGQLWQCSLCSKLFRSEHYLDRHLARKHPDLCPPSATVCLADLCTSIVPCFPISVSPAPLVSTAYLRALNSSGSSNETILHWDSPQNICNDISGRKRRERACEHVLRDCLHNAIHSERPASIQKHLVRLRSRLCERVVDVECTPRELLLAHANYSRIERAQYIFFLSMACVAVVAAFVLLVFKLLSTLGSNAHRLTHFQRHSRRGYVRSKSHPKRS